MSKRVILIATVYDTLPPRKIKVTGQTAKCLKALVDAGPKGKTALEVSTWALRFAAYCFDLRRKYGLEIRTDKETHDGGWHGRHVLETKVDIEEKDYE